ncbi:MAG: outer membrane beta-barrel protein [Bacteroidaceae bacterium]|nr:outer membrane beta-barrel protein [Bacteroidaceae bacterium]
MKKMNFFAAFALLAASSAVVMAQDFLTSASTDNYIVGYGAFNMGRIKIDCTEEGVSCNKEIEEGAEEYGNPDKPNGFGFGALYGYNIGGNLPLFVEAGAEIAFLFKNAKIEEADNANTKLRISNVSIPVNLTYHFGFNDITVAPVLGVNFKFYTKFLYTMQPEGVPYMEYINLYDDKLMKNISEEMGGAEDAISSNRFALGGNFGLNVSYKNFVLGYKFQPDFTELIKVDIKDSPLEFSDKFNSHIITLGYKF